MLGSNNGATVGQNGGGQQSQDSQNLFNSPLAQLLGMFGFANGMGNQSQNLQQIIQMLQGYMQQGQNNLAPYNQAGQNALPQFQNWLNQMGQNAQNFNPSQSVSDLMKNYKESDYAKYLTGQATNTINNQAAIGGTLGGGQNQRDVATMANQISSGDLQNYMNNVFNQQNYGLDLNKLFGGGLESLISGGEHAGEGQNQSMADFAKWIAQAQNASGQDSAASGQGWLSGLGGLASVIGSFF